MSDLFIGAWMLAPIVLGYLLWRCRQAGRQDAAAMQRLRRDLSSEVAEHVAWRERCASADAQLDRVRPYLQVADAADEASRLVADAEAKAQSLMEGARGRALEILAAAKSQASEALAYLGRERELKASIAALENRLNGYDDSYIKPAALLLEGLADSYGSAQAAVDLKQARAHTLRLMKEGKAAQCDYAQENRRATAIRFVADAFNGAADSVLARVKVTNVGKLEKELEDAASIINLHGSAFRNARVTPEYLASRRAELLASARFQELLKREQEEQRAIRERIREEARAQRDFEAAQRAAAREEERVRKALQEAQNRFNAAAAEDRSRLEGKLLELQQALAEAQAKGVRAMSMAQQTRSGHCYVISNEGSFGPDVLKIGMTRRLEPLDRVRELGDASVPFEFDVHAMVFSDDAPRLEKLLHREFNEARVNMVNPRKEYFRVGVADVRQKLASMGVKVEFTMAAEAREFRESQALRQASAEERKAALAAVLAAEEEIEEDAEDAAEASTQGGGPTPEVVAVIAA